MLNKEARKEIVHHALRWCNNIIVEVTSNHNESLSPTQRDAMVKVVRAIGEAEQVLRTGK